MQTRKRKRHKEKRKEIFFKFLGIPFLAFCFHGRWEVARRETKPSLEESIAKAWRI
jgi:hypothetical protein